MLNREIVSFRSCVRARGLVALWNWISNSAGRAFPFSLLPRVGRGAFLFWSWVVLGSFPFSLLGPGAFPFPFPAPQTSYPTLVGLIGIYIGDSLPPVISWHEDLCRVTHKSLIVFIFEFFFMESQTTSKD